MGKRSCFWFGFAAALVGLTTAVASAYARPLAPLSWSTAGFLDHQPPYGGGAPPAAGIPLSSISCPSSSLCVAGDGYGDIASSPNPAAGPAGWHVVHTAARVLPITPGIEAVSCPSVSLCVAVSPAGDALVSTNPNRRAATWKDTQVENAGVKLGFGRGGLSAVSCPSVSLCVAGDRDGNILVSTNPARGSWRTVPLYVDAGIFGIQSISCPTTRFCAAVDDSGHLITSTNPRGGTSAWRLTDVDGRNGIYGISCRSRELCVAVDGTAALTSTNPTGGPGAWRRAVIDGAVFHMTAVSCPSVSLCVATDQSGNVLTSTNPTGGATAWRSDSIDPTSSFAGGIPPLSGLTAVSCPSSTFCALTDSLGDLVRSTNPAGGASAWSIEEIDGANAPDDLTCPARWCVAVDQAGNVLTSTRPADPGAWQIRAADPGGKPGMYGTGAVSCPAATFCAAVDGDANVMTASAPLSSRSWNASTPDPGHKLASISCPSASLCVAVDEAGDAVVSSDPAAASPAWTVSQIDTDITSDGTQVALDDISCPSVSLCVAVDSGGNVVTSSDPAGGAPAWTVYAIDEGTALTTVSCPSAALCVAAGGSNLLVSTAPTAGNQAWKVSAIPNTPTYFQIQRISCTGIELCLASDETGDVLSSADPALGGPGWKLTAAEQFGIPTVACAPSSSCYAIDGRGDLLVGTQPTLAQILRGTAIPIAGERRIENVLAFGGHWVTLSPPILGRLSIVWRLRASHMTVAAGQFTFTDAQSHQFEVTLTRAGTRLLRHARRVAVIGTATFTPLGGRPLRISGGFSLRR